MVTVFWLVFRMVDLESIEQRLSSLPVTHIILAWLILLACQIVSAMRMRYYFSKFFPKFSVFFACTIYYVGAFYSLLLPGGVSGDGYRAYLLKKRKDIPLASSVRLVVCERANGLFLLGMLSCVFASLSQVMALVPHHAVLIMITMVLLCVGYFTAAKIILRDPPRVALGACVYSLLIQGGGAFSAALLLQGMGIEGAVLWDYLMIFMLSSALSIIPISIGGAGVRELTYTLTIGFAHQQGYTELSADIGVASALAFFALFMLSSLVGACFIPLLKRF